jgi:hypothetical protein
MNDEWIMIKLQVMSTMVIFVNIGVHNINLEKWSLQENSQFAIIICN